MGFKSKDRQRIIDAYLAESGENMFLPAAFVDWLADKPDHEMYGAFYGLTDGEAARKYRIEMARQMASGLRIVVADQPTKSSVVQIITREYPAYISPVASRKSGGGYQTLDPHDKEMLAELRRQGASALRGWLGRYRGAFELVGVDLSSVEKIAASEDVSVAKSA